MVLPFSLPIAKPPWKGLGKRLESAIRKACFDFQLLEGVSKLAIALSGGKDSLSLLFFLHAISGRGFPKLELTAIHVSGKYSCGPGVQESYLSAICQELEIPFISCASQSQQAPQECYSCSRERRRLLFDAAKSVGATTLAFGHHRDDHVQTLLMNLLHKGEFAGNLPKIFMRDFGITIIRPLIYIAEDDLSLFAQDQGFKRITCQCPIGQNSMRKQVNSLLTEMELLFPNARENLAQGGLRYGSQKAQYPNFFQTGNN